MLPICSCSRQQFQFLTTTSWLKELKIWQLRVFVKTNDLKKSRRKWQAEYIILGRQRLIAFANWHYWNEAPSIPNKSMKYSKKPDIILHILDSLLYRNSATILIKMWLVNYCNNSLIRSKVGDPFLGGLLLRLHH